MSVRQFDQAGSREQARLLVESRRLYEAIGLYREICANDAADADAWFMLCSVYARLGLLDEATECCRKVLELAPGHTGALYRLAGIEMQQGRLDDALAGYRRILEADSSHQQAMQGLRHAEGIRDARQQPSAAGRQSEDLFEQGARFHRQGDWKQAFDCYRAALDREPDSLRVLTSLGFVCHMLGNYEVAAECHRHALRLNPALTGERYNLAIASKELLRLQDAVECYRQVLLDQPDSVEAHHGFGIARIMQGYAGEADEILRQALQIKPSDLVVRSCLLLAQNYYCNDPERLFQEHLEWDRHNPQRPLPALPGRETRGNKLRIGYVSADFCAHPVAFFIEPLLARHDKSAFEIFCYADVAQPDGVTAHLQGLVSGWRDTRPLPDEELAARVQQDRIDILVDLAGHTAGNRLQMFARKPAPVQVTYLGYPNTTGMRAMDYRLTDNVADPPGETDHLFTERLVRLPAGFLCYRPLEGTAVSPLPLTVNGYITFGSCNNLAKVTPDIIALWSRLLQQVPDARLLLKARSLEDAATREHIHAQFAARGIGRERVDLAGWIDGMGGHLGLYERIDIALDTFPYNGTTTTCEALWMGVPVITLAGQTHAGRVGVSLLTQTGLPGFIAAEPDAYIALAAGLARDPARLARLRAGLRERLARSSLCDAAAFTRHVEDAYRKMWKQRGKG